MSRFKSGKRGISRTGPRRYFIRIGADVSPEMAKSMDDLAILENISRGEIIRRSVSFYLDKIQTERIVKGLNYHGKNKGKEAL